MPTKKKGGADCQLFAMNEDQLKNLQLQHWARYNGEEDINCNGCLKVQEAMINGATGLVLPITSGGHDKKPTTCLQAFWRICCQSGRMNKNGNLGKKAEVSLLEVEMAEKAMSRATTAPGTPGT